MTHWRPSGLPSLRCRAASSEQLAFDALYAGYLHRQKADIAAFKKDESLRLPDDLDYALIKGLSNEVRQKLKDAQPATLGQAGRH